MTTKTLWLIVVAICGVGWLVCHWLNRRDRRASEHLDAALLHGADWVHVDDEAAADCLDCAQDQAIGITKDGSHDRIGLSMCERITFEEIEHEFYRETS